ncbi:MAG: N-acetylmuramoyl-L-alanine amidase [Oscillospiraceae bacterium]|nr:N-acetylmuramoyl-L-alanine amidase [Oscillospiraceae bacterium]
MMRFLIKIKSDDKVLFIIALGVSLLITVGIFSVVSYFSINIFNTRINVEMDEQSDRTVAAADSNNDRSDFREYAAIPAGADRDYSDGGDDDDGGEERGGRVALPDDGMNRVLDVRLDIGTDASTLVIECADIIHDYRTVDLMGMGKIYLYLDNALLYTARRSIALDDAASNVLSETTQYTALNTASGAQYATLGAASNAQYAALNTASGAQYATLGAALSALDAAQGVVPNIVPDAAQGVVPNIVPDAAQGVVPNIVPDAAPGVAPNITLGAAPGAALRVSSSDSGAVEDALIQLFDSAEFFEFVSSPVGGEGEDAGNVYSVKFEISLTAWGRYSVDTYGSGKELHVKIFNEPARIGPFEFFEDDFGDVFSIGTEVYRRMRILESAGKNELSLEFLFSVLDEDTPEIPVGSVLSELIPESKYVRSIGLVNAKSRNSVIMNFIVADNCVFMAKEHGNEYRLHFMDRKETPIIYFEENGRSHIYFDNEKVSQNHFNYTLSGGKLMVQTSFAGMNAGRIFNADGFGGNIDFAQTYMSDMTEMIPPGMAFPASGVNYNVTVDSVMSRGLLFSYNRNPVDAQVSGQAGSLAGGSADNATSGAVGGSQSGFVDDAAGGSVSSLAGGASGSQAGNPTGGQASSLAGGSVDGASGNQADNPANGLMGGHADNRADSPAGEAPGNQGGSLTGGASGNSVSSPADVQTGSPADDAAGGLVDDAADGSVGGSQSGSQSSPTGNPAGGSVSGSQSSPTGSPADDAAGGSIDSPVGGQTGNLAGSREFEGSFTEEQLNSVMGMTVVIDAGHGGKDGGAVYPITSGLSADRIIVAEKDLNLDITLKLEELLNGIGINTIKTRADDTYVELRERANIANMANADFFLSIHNNSGVIPERTNGTMTLYYPSPYAGRFGISGEHAAQIIQRRLIEGIGFLDRGVWKRPGLAVLSNTLMPAVLVEVGYLPSDRERTMLMEADFRQFTAELLCDGVIEVLLNIRGGMIREEAVFDIKKYVRDEYTRVGRRSTHLGNVGFVLPDSASAKCVYEVSDSRNGNKYHLTIKIEYFDATTTERDLKAMADELRTVIQPVMGKQAADGILNQVRRLSNNTSHAFGQSFSGGGFVAQVSCMRYTGTCYVEIDKT